MALPVLATAATLSYLSAKLRLPSDYLLLSSVSKTLAQIAQLETADRINGFNLIESNALDASIAHKALILSEGGNYTFREFYDMVLRYAGWLRECFAVARGDVVAVMFLNSPEMLAVIGAVWSLGATPALVNYNLVGEGVLHSLRTAGARVWVVEGEVAAKVLTEEVRTVVGSGTFRKGGLPMETVVLGEELRASLKYWKGYRAEDSARQGVDGGGAAALMSTSGTSGMPKQAVCIWTRFYGGGYMSSRLTSMRSVKGRGGDTIYVTMPFYHATAFAFGFGNAMVSKSTLAIGRKFSASRFWDDVRKYGATAVLYVGETLRYLVAAPERPGEDRDHKVRVAIGNGCRIDVWNTFKTRFGVETILELYGATEGPFASFNLSRNDYSAGAIGQYGPLARRMVSKNFALVKVDWEQEQPWRDPDTGFCKEVSPGQPGELLVKIDPDVPRTRFHGYHNNEKETQKKILQNVFVAGDKYFRSGDVLRWDTDGRMFFSDRLGDTFRWRSENVSTAEVGEVLGQHNAVIEANVYGVKVPGHEGRAGCAAILFKDSALETSAEGTSVKADVLRSLAAYARTSLQPASIPIFVRTVTEMLSTGNHKTIKHVLRNEGVDLQIIQEAGSGDQIYWLPSGAEGYVKFGAEQWTALGAGKARL